MLSSGLVGYIFSVFFFLSTRLKVICLSKLKIIHFPHETPAPSGCSPCNPALRDTAASMLPLLLSVRPTGHPVAWFSGWSFGSLPAASPSCMVPPTRPGPPQAVHTQTCLGRRVQAGVGPGGGRCSRHQGEAQASGFCSQDAGRPRPLPSRPVMVTLRLGVPATSGRGGLVPARQVPRTGGHLLSLLCHRVLPCLTLSCN